jgi:phage gpG-like protein
VKYGKYHQTGFTIKKIFQKPHVAKVPARPFMMFQPEDTIRIEAIIRKLIAEV